jgi:hypothetical protein
MSAVTRVAGGDVVHANCRGSSDRAVGHACGAGGPQRASSLTLFSIIRRGWRREHSLPRGVRILVLRGTTGYTGDEEPVPTTWRLRLRQEGRDEISIRPCMSSGLCAARQSRSWRSRSTLRHHSGHRLSPSPAPPGRQLPRRRSCPRSPRGRCHRCIWQ